MLGQRLGVVLHAEVGHAARGRGPRSATSGSSAFSTKRARPSRPLDQLRPAVGEQLELAVAVELVAEQVGEQQQARVELARPRSAARPRRPRTAPAGPRPRPGVEQRGGHSPGHVRAGAVVDHRAPGALEAGREHRGRGRLAVRGRDQHRALVEVAGHAARARPARARSSSRPGAVVPPLRPSAAADGPQQRGRARARGAVHQRRRTMTRRQRVLHAHGGGGGRRSGRRPRRSRTGGRSSPRSPRRAGTARRASRRGRP